MKKTQAVSLSMMIALGVLMANGAMAEAQNRKDASRRSHDNPNQNTPVKSTFKPISERLSRQRLQAIRSSDD